MSRQAHWQKVYGEKAPADVSWFQADPALSLSFIRKYAAVDRAVIDIGAGASVLADKLVEAGYDKVSLLDISSEALDVTRTRLGVRADRIASYIASDIQAFSPVNNYQVWHDRAVLHFLTSEEDQKAYKRALDAGLVGGGYFIVGTFAIGGPEKCSGLAIRQYDETRMADFLGEGYGLVEKREELHQTPWGSEQKFAWFVYRKLT